MTRLSLTLLSLLFVVPPVQALNLLWWRDNPIDIAFNRSWQVQTDTPVTDMKRVSVTVTFPTDSADSQAVVTTMIARGLR